MHCHLHTRISHKGLFEKKSKQGGLKRWNLKGYQRNSMWNFQRSIKIEVKFPKVTKKKYLMWNFKGVFDFGLGISKGSNTSLWNNQRLSFALSGIFRGKLKK